VLEHVVEPVRAPGYHATVGQRGHCGAPHSRTRTRACPASPFPGQSHASVPPAGRREVWRGLLSGCGPGIPVHVREEKRLRPIRTKRVGPGRDTGDRGVYSGASTPSGHMLSRNWHTHAAICASKATADTKA
jgi:hypothetical protein